MSDDFTKICESEFCLRTEGLGIEDFSTLLTGMIPQIKKSLAASDPKFTQAIMSNNIPGTLRIRLTIDFNGPITLGPLIMSKNPLIVN